MDNFPTAPPPPAEVKIRTMRSDLESMAKSGGGMPQSEIVKVTGLSAQKTSETAVIRAESKNNLLIIILVIVAVAAVVVVGWLVYTRFFAVDALSEPTSSNQTVPSSPAPSQSNQAAIPVAAPTTSFTHASFFKTPADQVLSMTLAASSTTYSQQLLAVLATAKKGATFLEIDAKDASGNDASINELLAAANAQVVDPQVLSANFDPDATFFVYRDANGFWPGYVIALNQDQNWLAVQSGVQAIESSPDVANIFLENVGTASPDGFTDSMIASSSVRVLPFFGASVPGYFVYGWTQDHQYLILSSSQDGFAAALGRLGNAG